MSNETEALKDAAADAFDRFGEAYDALKVELAAANEKVRTLTEERVGMVLVSFAAHDVLTKAEAERDILKAERHAFGMKVAQAVVRETYATAPRDLSALVAEVEREQS